MKNAVRARGFTLVEIVITMTVMVILLGLGVMSIGNMQTQARDNERENDIETIARGLEQRYKKGNPIDPVTSFKPGSYPGHNEIFDSLSNKVDGDKHYSLTKTIPGTSDASFSSPSGKRMKATCWLYAWDQPFCDAVGKDAVIQREFRNSETGAYEDIYLYEYIGSDNKYCNGAASSCVRYNLYWISETDSTVYKGIPGLKVRESQHQ